MLYKGDTEELERKKAKGLEDRFYPANNVG
jgi:hypothetical protein